MKYIVFKDGSARTVVNSEYYALVNTYVLGTILRARDTIEELCDFFVVYEIGGGFIGEYRTYKDLELAKYSMGDKVSVLYGAVLMSGIHGEPILKPIAKMNDNGRLELL